MRRQLLWCGVLAIVCALVVAGVGMWAWRRAEDHTLDPTLRAKVAQILAEDGTSERVTEMALAGFDENARHRELWSEFLGSIAVGAGGLALLVALYFPLILRLTAPPEPEEPAAPDASRPVSTKPDPAPTT
jgi:hypothetical protein